VSGTNALAYSDNFSWMTRGFRTVTSGQSYKTFLDVITSLSV